VAEVTVRPLVTGTFRLGRPLRLFGDDELVVIEWRACPTTVR